MRAVVADLVLPDQFRFIFRFRINAILAGFKTFRQDCTAGDITVCKSGFIIRNLGFAVIKVHGSSRDDCGMLRIFLAERGTILGPGVVCLIFLPDFCNGQLFLFIF